jgi:hypothetical protein
METRHVPSEVGTECINTGSEVAALKNLYYLEPRIVVCRAVAVQRP